MIDADFLEKSRFWRKLTDIEMNDAIAAFTFDLNRDVAAGLDALKQKVGLVGGGDGRTVDADDHIGASQAELGKDAAGLNGCNPDAGRLPVSFYRFDRDLPAYPAGIGE